MRKLIFNTDFRFQNLVNYMACDMVGRTKEVFLRVFSIAKTFP